MTQFKKIEINYLYLKENLTQNHEQKKKNDKEVKELRIDDESEELSTDDTENESDWDTSEVEMPKPKEEEDDLGELINTKRERRQSNLVRINTQTKWTESQMDALEQQLLDQISFMASQNGYDNTKPSMSSAQFTRSSDLSQMSMTTSTEMTTLQGEVDGESSTPKLLSPNVMTESKKDIWTISQMCKREQEMRQQMELLKLECVPNIVEMGEEHNISVQMSANVNVTPEQNSVLQKQEQEEKEQQQQQSIPFQVAETEAETQTNPTDQTQVVKTIKLTDNVQLLLKKSDKNKSFMCERFCCAIL